MSNIKLLPQHAALLKASAISDEVIEARGYRSVDTKVALERLGFSKPQCQAPALLIPVWNVTGENALYQIRPDIPRIVAGKRLKYETPQGARMVLDVPPPARQWLGDPSRPLFVTEGPRKADAAVSQGLCCISLLGVWNWRGTNEHGGKVALPDWESIALNERAVYVVFDSDVATKPHVQQALARLKAFLEQRHARVHIVYLPTSGEGAKVGLDDFFAEGHSVENLLTLVSDELRPPVDKPQGTIGINSNATISDLQRFIESYLVLPDHAALALALWAAATHLYQEFDTFPYLAITSPAKRCGKTRLAEVLSCVALNPVLTTGISEAALFRLVDKGECTLLLDEAETLKEKRNERSQAIVSILNSGFRQGAHVYRCAPRTYELQPFTTYGPKAILAIGTLPDTVRDRSILIPMRRKAASDNVARFLLRRAHNESHPLRRQLQELAKNKRASVNAVYESLPQIPDLSDRDEELWQPLFAICSVLAVDKLGQLKEAALALSGSKAESDVDNSLPLRLLADIEELLTQLDENILSGELVDKLREQKDSPWGEPSLELTQNRLARMLKPFGIHSRNIRRGEKVQKGYLKTELRESIGRYIDSQTATGATVQQ